MLGGAGFLAAEGIDTSPLTEKAEVRRRQGATVVLAALDGALAGFFAVADPVKRDSAEVVRKLAGQGVRIVRL